ncbi:hypothetical protein [Anatilimnocola floriformis]|uniref:hypothetical protein n=1 Tax=Anatilimnocola floriformis TaxID=2948575 RepID=UPI0020C516B3|nr:hypothetical protein [Anatilimnocola floriformis]
MSTPLDITGGDIALLNDSDFRVLVRGLCEADLRIAGHSLLGVDTGGNQNAGDGGLDVVVTLNHEPPANSFIPRRNTGIQVKTSPMPKGKITAEMRPKNVLREEIKELVAKNGAYVIACSKDSLSQTMLKQRLGAMKTALGRAKGFNSTALHFLDQNKIAQWVGCHPSWGAWVRTQIGRPIAGWRPLGNWSRSPQDDDEYIIDDHVRFFDRRNADLRGSSVLDGIRTLRTSLSSAQACVRIAGLSGIGKTRFVQSLFDPRVAENPLNPDWALYADMSDDPHPSPVVMATALLAAGTPMHLVVDNCPRDLHKKLADICTQPNSRLNLVTVEYDVRDDIYDDSIVFKLEPASDQLIETLLERRFPEISEVNRRQIAAFSGGNSRLAIAISKTVKPNESIGHLRDLELFDRLFQQRNTADHGLRKSAEVCSLVYSFDVEEASPGSELASLACLGQKAPVVLYSDIAELRMRDLVQARGPFRAVLPHALANAMASCELETLPIARLLAHFIAGPPRLLQSFCHRLSFLVSSPVARRIASELLSQIEDSLAHIDKHRVTLLEYIAPVVTEETLKAFERASKTLGSDFVGSHMQTHRWSICKILWHIAYNEKHFRRATNILIEFAINETKDSSAPGQHFLRILFQSRYSGTKASPELRAQVVSDLLSSPESKRQSLGVELFSAALEDEPRAIFDSFEFGACDRDYGLSLTTRAEIREWFAQFFNIVLHFGCSASVVSEQVRSRFAERLFGVWVHVGLHDEVSDVARRLHSHRPWTDGWGVIRMILQYRHQLSKACVDAAVLLNEEFAPKDFIAKIRAIALSNTRDIPEPGDANEEFDICSAYERSYKVAFDLGVELATECSDELKDLLPEIVRSGGPRVFSFAQGIASGINEPDGLLDVFIDTYLALPNRGREMTAIHGVMVELWRRKRELVTSAVERLSHEPQFATFLPELQLQFWTDGDAAAIRLNRAIGSGLVDAFAFRRITYQVIQRKLGDQRLLKILAGIQPLKGAEEITIDALDARLTDKENTRSNAKMKTFARRFLLQWQLAGRAEHRDMQDYHLASITRNCVSGKTGRKVAMHLCKAIGDGVESYAISSYSYPQLMSALAAVGPEEFLDRMLIQNGRRRRSYFLYDHHPFPNPIEQIPECVLLAWCEKDPAVRYTKIAATLSPYEKPASDPLKWKPLALAILERAPNVKAMIAIFCGVAARN